MDRLDLKFEGNLVNELNHVLGKDDTEELRNLYLGPKDDPNPNWVKEDSIIDVRRGRSMLHMAIGYISPKCVKLLIEEPYNWSVDKPDAEGASAMRQAEEQDRIEQLEVLAPKSLERRFISDDKGEPHVYRISTSVVWPQQLWHFPVKREQFFIWQERGVRASESSREGKIVLVNYRQMFHMCGMGTALLFELMMATPEAYAMNIWTGNEALENPAERRFWPMPSLTKMAEDKWAHDPECTNYPNCLNTLIRNTLHVDRALALRRLADCWVTHRFYQVVDGKCISGPPKLKDFSRVAVRRQLVTVTDPKYIVGGEQFIHENYFRHVSQLSIQKDLQEYLMYKELWNEWGRQMYRETDQLKKSNIFFNVFYESPLYGPGRIFGNGFVPAKRSV